MNKINIPMIGLGTWLIPNDEAELITKDAINLGYKHIDTAEIYRNEEGIGKAIKSLSVANCVMPFITKTYFGETDRRRGNRHQADSNKGRRHQ